jgi:hypothetical protein
VSSHINVHIILIQRIISHVATTGAANSQP